MCRYFTFLLFFVSILTLNAQEKNKTFSQQEWLQYYSQIQLSDNFSLLSDVGIRTRNNFTELSQLLVRSGLSYNLKPSTSVTLGFANFTTFNSNKLTKTEYRPYQELLFKHVLNSFNLQHRIRIEERVFHSEPSGYTNFNFRFRYRLYLTYPVVKFRNSQQSLFVILADEIFLTCGKEINYNFDQSRMIVGVGYSPNKKLQFSLSYVHQYGQKNTPDNFEVSEIFWFGITHKIEKK